MPGLSSEKALQEWLIFANLKETPCYQEGSISVQFENIITNSFLLSLLQSETEDNNLKPKWMEILFLPDIWKICLYHTDTYYGAPEQKIIF